MSSRALGVTLANGSKIMHGQGIKSSTPFQRIPVTTHEFTSGTTGRPAFRGQAGFIEFDTSIRLPRHVHISTDPVDGKPRLLHERIFVSDGAAIVELGGQRYVIPPKTSVTIAPGVPHTWTACPPGVDIVPDQGSVSEDKSFVSDGTFLMLYEYEEITSFFPTSQTETLNTIEDYVRCDDLEDIRIPSMSAEEVNEHCWFVYNSSIQKKNHC